MHKYLIAVFLIIVVISSSLLLIDDNLTPEAQKMYEQTIFHSESDAYVYFLGLPVEEEPEVAGQVFLKAIRKTEQNILKNPCTMDRSIVYPEKKKLLPVIELDSCDREECSYIDKLFSTKLSPNKLNKLKPSYKRYNKFLSFSDYHTLSRLGMSTPFANFEFILKGSDLTNYMAIEKAKNNNHKDATTLLLNNISKLRPHLQQADTLFGKVIYTAAISRSIDVLSILKKTINHLDRILIR